MGRSERDDSRSRYRRYDIRGDRGDRGDRDRDREERRDRGARGARGDRGDRDRGDLRRDTRSHGVSDRSRGRRSHDDARHLREDSYAKVSYRHTDRRSRAEHEDRYPDVVARPDRDRYARDYDSHRHNLSRGERERGHDYWDEREDHWERRGRDERREQRERRDGKEQSDRYSNRGRMDARGSQTREVFVERRAPDIRERDNRGIAELKRRADFQHRNEVKRPRRISDANDVQLGQRRGGEHQSQRDGTGRKETEWHGPEKAQPDSQQNNKLIPEQDGQSSKVVDAHERQSQQPQSKVEVVKELVAPSAAVEVLKHLSVTAPSKGEEHEEGEIGSETSLTSESEECNSEADFDASEEEALPIAVAEKAAEAQEAKEADTPNEAETRSEAEAGRLAEEAQRGSEDQPEAQLRLGQAESGSQRSDFSRTIPVPQALAKDVKGACSSGARIKMAAPERSKTEPCLVTVSGTREEVDLAVSQIRSLQKRRGAKDSVELRIPKDTNSQKLLHLIKERIKHLKDVAIQVDDDKQEYYKVRFSGQPPDIERAWLLSVKEATLSKAEEVHSSQHSGSILSRRH